MRDNGAGSLTVAVQLRYRTASVSDRLLLFFHDPSPLRRGSVLPVCY